MTCYIFHYSLLDTLDKAQLNLRMDCGELAACFIRYMCRLTRVDYVWETVRHLITLQSLFQQIKKMCSIFTLPPPPEVLIHMGDEILWLLMLFIFNTGLDKRECY